LAADGTPLPPKPRQVARPPYNGPPYDWREMSPGCQVLHLNTCEAAKKALDALMSPSMPPVVGFDIEWRPSFIPKQPENPVALVQISTYDTILLLQLSSIQAVPDSLWRILESPETTKVGVNIANDCIKLYRDWGLSVRNCIELSLMARSADPSWTGKYNSPLGLAHLVEVYLERSLPKGHISRSNWEDDPLSEKQKDYAANDAHAGYMIYTKLASKITEMEPIP
ncbi:ribonuclease H-like domain-containing protein, partial [Vararia minispora EC-137]